MRQDYFTFLPTFKLIIAGNHKPSLRNVDEAIKRRFNLIPFTVTTRRALFSGIRLLPTEGDEGIFTLCPPES